MAIENFINFGAAISFFVGLFFAFLKFSYITDILLGCFIISMLFFLIISLCATFVVKYLDIKDQDYLEKDIYDTVLEDYKVKINKSHSKLEVLAGSLHKLEIASMMEQDRLEKQKKES